MVDREAWLGSRLAVDDLAVGAIGAGLLAAAELAQARGFGDPAVELSAEHAALSFVSERHLLIDGRPGGPGFAPLSRLVRCREGWARTHGNYPHHAAALARALGLGDAPTPETLAAAASQLCSRDLEARVIEHGGCAAALRSAEEWATHPAGQAVAAEPLVAWGAMPDGAPLATVAASAHPSRPATGVRVLDLTRVIAGPVAGRTLAAFGATVLRVDPPGLPEIAAQHADTGAGKLTTVLDLADDRVREELLRGADAVLIGYRPGALSRFGLGEAHLAERHPHLVQVRLAAWGHSGPWSGRRGFDSLVQVGSGIAASLCADDGTPGALPAQALDHATGHLMAAAALRGLARRARGEPAAAARLSLARTAGALLGARLPADPLTDATGAADPDRFRVAFGGLSLIGPPGRLDGEPLRWAHGPRPLGADPAAWPPRA